MKLRAPIFRLAALFAAAAAAGWWIAENSRPPAEKATPQTGRKTVPPSGKGAAAAKHDRIDEYFAAVWRAGSPSAQSKAAVELAALLPPGDFRQALDRMDALPVPTARDLFAAAILHRWVAFEPKAALEWCRLHDGVLTRDSMRAWAQLDPPAAEAFLARNEVDRERLSSAISGFFDGLARKDPASAFAAAAAHPPWSAYDFHEGFQTLAQSDPDRLLAASAGFSAQIQALARKAAVGALARRDYAKTISWLLTQPNAADLLSAAGGAAPDSASFLSAAAQIPIAERERIISQGALSIGQRDPVGMLRGLASGALSLSPQATKSAADVAWVMLAHLDPQEAIRLSNELNVPAEWKSAGAIARQWAEKDPNAALAWAQSLGPEKIDATTLAEIQAKAAALTWNPSAVERALADIRAGDGRLFGRLPTAQDRATVLDALATSDTGPTSAVADVLGSVAMQFPAEFAAWALRQPESDQRDRHLDIAVSQWSTADPQAAASWITNELPDAQRRKAIGTLLTRWKMNDPDGAKAWFRALPEETRRGVTPPGEDW